MTRNVGWILLQPIDHEFAEMNVVCDSHVMVVELQKHELPGELQRLRGVNPASLNADHRLLGFRMAKDT